MRYVMEILNLLLNEYNIKAVKFTLLYISYTDKSNNCVSKSLFFYLRTKSFLKWYAEIQLGIFHT